MHESRGKLSNSETTVERGIIMRIHSHCKTPHDWEYINKKHHYMCMSCGVLISDTLVKKLFGTFNPDRVNKLVDNPPKYMKVVYG